MLLLANREIMAVHMAQLLQVRLHQVLTHRGMQPSKVEVHWEKTALGKATPDFQVAYPDGFPVDKAAVRECIKDVWQFYKVELNDRFSGLTARRED